MSSFLVGDIGVRLVLPSFGKRETPLDKQAKRFIRIQKLAEQYRVPLLDDFGRPKTADVLGKEVHQRVSKEKAEKYAKSRDRRYQNFCNRPVPSSHQYRSRKPSFNDYGYGLLF